MTTCILADDELHLTRYLADQLKAAWPELEILGIAANGVEADALIAEHQPDLAFLDIGMPGLTGYEVARMIRQTAGMDQTVLVALTGWGADHDQDQARKAGFNHHLTKPADIAAIDSLLAAQSARAAT